jgi:hypothetical protein
MRSFSSGQIMALKNFIDVAAIITHNFQVIRWQVLRERSEQYRVLRPVFLVLFMVQEFFHISIPLPLWSILEQQGLTHENIQMLVSERIFCAPRCIQKFPNAFLQFFGRQSPGAGRHSIVKHMARVACQAFTKEYYRVEENSIMAICKRGLRKIAVSLKNNIISTVFFVFRRASMERKIQSEQEKKSRLAEINKWLQNT